MPSLTTNLVKRVERLPKPTNASEAMQPLFEAVSNAIHSVQKKYGRDVARKGIIRVTVENTRGTQPLLATVEDNGVGLDDAHYLAFTTTDTDHKIEIGGKGVGRLLWLDCFESICVTSRHEQDGLLHEKSFDFRLSLSDQIQNLKDGISTSGISGTGVTVTFQGLRDNGYKAKFPRRAAYIFQHITSHFLPTFIGNLCPAIIVSCGDETREYPGEIANYVHRRVDYKGLSSEKFGDLDFILMECDKVASSDLQGSHFVHFIAHDRTVWSQRIDGKLGLKYFGPEDNRVFHGCVFGQYLNANVNQERTSFTFEDSIIDDIVNEVCMPHIDIFLEEPLKELNDKQGGIVQKIVDKYPSVSFGTVEELQKYIPSGELSDDAIYAHLARQRYRRDQKQDEKIRDVLKRLKGDHVDENTLAQAIEEASKAIEDSEQRSLAEYVVRRKVVLDFIELLIQKVRDDTADSSYQREDVLHTFICPMKVNTISDGGKKIVPASSHDLWIIDERLTFAKYFTSDVPFKEMADTIASDERPDLLIFDKVHGLRQSNDSSKIMLVEFKRPGRTNYTDDENPHLQVQRYIKKLQEGGELDVNGRPIRVKPDTVFYCFIVADCVGRMEEWTYSWSPTADGRGKVYQPRNGFVGSIELIEWGSLIADARERNAAFFDRAGMSNNSLFSDDA